MPVISDSTRPVGTSVMIELRAVRHPHLQPVGRRDQAAAAGQFEISSLRDLEPPAATPACRSAPSMRVDLHLRERGADRHAAVHRARRIERLEARGVERRASAQHGCDARDYATTFTILCGTTMTFFGGLPSSARCTASSASTAASISVFAASRATVTSARFLPLTCTGRVIGVLDQQRGARPAARAPRRPGSCGRAPPSIPRPDAASSARTAAPGFRQPRAWPRRGRRDAAVFRRGERRPAGRWRTRRCARRSG